MSTSPAELVIRSLRLPDEAAVAADMMSGSEPWRTLRRDRETCLRLLLDPTREVYAAVAGSEVIGALVLALGGPFNGYIQSVVVRADWRNRGVGQRLIVFAEDRIFRGSPNVFLCVSDFNTAAQRLYARLGYERVGELRDYAVRGHSEILLRKTKGPLNA